MNKIHKKNTKAARVASGLLVVRCPSRASGLLNGHQRAVEARRVAVDPLAASNGIERKVIHLEAPSMSPDAW